MSIVTDARALADLAAAAFGVEREHPRRDAVQLRAGRLGEQLADLVPGLDVRRRIRARGAADRRLIDELHVVDQVRPFETRRPCPVSRPATPRTSR